MGVAAGGRADLCLEAPSVGDVETPKGWAEVGRGARDLSQPEYLSNGGAKE